MRVHLEWISQDGKPQRGFIWYLSAKSQHIQNGLVWTANPNEGLANNLPKFSDRLGHTQNGFIQHLPTKSNPIQKRFSSIFQHRDGEMDFSGFYQRRVDVSRMICQNGICQQRANVSGRYLSGICQQRADETYPKWICPASASATANTRADGMDLSGFYQ